MLPIGGAIDSELMPIVVRCSWAGSQESEIADRVMNAQRIGGLILRPLVKTWGRPCVEGGCRLSVRQVKAGERMKMQLEVRCAFRQEKRLSAELLTDQMFRSNVNFPARRGPDET